MTDLLSKARGNRPWRALPETCGGYTLPVGLTFQRQRTHIFQFFLIFNHPYLKENYNIISIGNTAGFAG